MKKLLKPAFGALIAGVVSMGPATVSTASAAQCFEVCMCTNSGEGAHGSVCWVYVEAAAMIADPHGMDIPRWPPPYVDDWPVRAALMDDGLTDGPDKLINRPQHPPRPQAADFIPLGPPVVLPGGVEEAYVTAVLETKIYVEAGVDTQGNASGKAGVSITF